MLRSYAKPSKPSAAHLLPQPLRHHHIGHGLHGGGHALNAQRSLEDRLAARAYVSQSRDLEQAKERALDVTERIQEVIRLAVEFELVAMD